MEIPAYSIARPRGVAGRRAVDRLQTRCRVLDNVILMPPDPGVETFERVILDELLSPDSPDRIFFQEIEWGFAELISKWPEVGIETLHTYATIAWSKIHKMTQPTR